MPFILFDKTTGKIDSVRDAQGIVEASDMAAHVFGAFVPTWFDAIAHDGLNVGPGKMVDVATRTLVDDPSYVPPPEPTPTTTTP